MYIYQSLKLFWYIMGNGQQALHQQNVQSQLKSDEENFKCIVTKFKLYEYNSIHFFCFLILADNVPE